METTNDHLNTHLSPSGFQYAKRFFSIFYRSEDFCIVYKPSSVCIDGDEAVTLEKLTLESFASNGLEKPKLYLCHQLDRGTSGLLLYALNSSAAKQAGNAFTSRNVVKVYIAVVYGHINTNESFLVDHGQREKEDGLSCVPESEYNPGRACVTEVRCVWTGFYKDKPISKLHVTLHTGRRHQIRVHLAQLGFPIVGDRDYCPGHLGSEASRMHLHNLRLAIPSLNIDVSTKDPFPNFGPPSMPSPAQSFAFFPPKHETKPEKAAILLATAINGKLNFLLRKQSRQDEHRTQSRKGNVWGFSAESKFKAGNCDILDSAVHQLPTSDVIPHFKRKRISTLNPSLAEPIQLSQPCFQPPLKKRKIDAPQTSLFMSNELGSYIRMGGVYNAVVDCRPYFCVYISLLPSDVYLPPRKNVSSKYKWFSLSAISGRDFDHFISNLPHNPQLKNVLGQWISGKLPKQFSGFNPEVNVFMISLPAKTSKVRDLKKAKYTKRGPFQPLSHLPLFWSGFQIRKEKEKIEIFSLVIDLSGVEFPDPESCEILQFDIADRNTATLFPILEVALPRMREFLDDNRSVLVHCEIGRSRSVAVLCAYLLWAEKLPLRDVFEICNEQARTQINGRFKYELTLLEAHWLGENSWKMEEKLINRLARSVDVSKVCIPEDFRL